MKTSTIIMAALLLSSMSLRAQQVVESTYDRLDVHYQTPALTESAVTTDGYISLSFAGSVAGGTIGAPALPQMSSIIEVPVCKGFEVTVANAVYDTIRLPYKPLPLQPSRSKSDTSARSLVIDREAYLADAFNGADLASVEYIGVARDRHIARLVFSPVRFNVARGLAVVCRKADITVRYIGADQQATDDLYSRYHTPAYSFGTTLGSLPTPKYVSNATPVRMAVVTISSLRCQKLEEFLMWKRQQGLRVDVFYIDELGIQSPAAINSTLKALYTDATEANPAPAYLLVIGDIAQVPANASRVTSPSYAYNDHFTDLYYTTWSNGDNIPDCYHGRMSASDTTTLIQILNKTLLYEQYLFPDDSYLGRAALIAGVDQSWGTNTSDNAYTYADPAMDYIASLYVNHANGYDTISYYKNRTSFAPNGVTVTGSCRANNTASTLRQYYNQGAGWINYSAHGDWNEWSIPEFTTSHVNNMSNNWMPSFMIGNCCLSNKFDKATCFGEALLRKGNNAGAIGYIGASNYTYWSEDYYWAVGMRNNISGTMTPTYNANNRGCYDYLFHTHGEALNATAATAGKMMYFGNMAVQNAGAQLTHYYWEVYHLMGDPTLMPWLGRADDPYVVVNDDAEAVYIGTHSGAYIAVVDPADDMRVISATFADANGNATLSVPANHSGLMLSITSQGHKPYHHTFGNLGIAADATADATVYPNPTTGLCNVRCNGMRQLQVINSLGQTLRTVATQGDDLTLDLRDLARGVYILRIHTTAGTVTKKLMVR